MKNQDVLLLRQDLNSHFHKKSKRISCLFCLFPFYDDFRYENLKEAKSFKSM